MSFSKDSKFYCVICGNESLPILRVRGKEREAGHLKKIFCLHCQKETNSAECKEWTKYSHDDFIFEFENGNFNESGDRNMPYGKFKDKMQKEGKLNDSNN